MSSGSGGLGWFIYENKNQLEIPNVFAGLFTVIVIGLIVENVVFRVVEARTVRKWGLQSRVRRPTSFATTVRIVITEFMDEAAVVALAERFDVSTTRSSSTGPTTCRSRSPTPMR